MKRAVFYTLNCSRGIVGLKKRYGFEFEKDGIKLNGYVNEDNDVYIIDPKTGISIFNNKKTHESEQEALEYAREFLLNDKSLIEKWKALKLKNSYKLTVKMFSAYKKAEKLREKQKEAVMREMKAKEE